MTTADLVHPGKHIEDELKKKQWSQADLAFIIGCAPSRVSALVTGRTKITATTARILEAALSIPAMQWLDWQVAWTMATFVPRKRRTGKCSFCPTCGRLKREAEGPGRADRI